MFKKLVVALALLAGSAAAAEEAEHLDLEVVVEGGRRELFPLLPGTKCPAGHRCRARSHRAGVSPMMSALKNNIKNPIAEAEAIALNNDLTTTVSSNDHCTRRAAMARAAGLAAGLSVATVGSPAYAAETKEVLLGSDSGQLVFVPAQLKICKGDTVKWINNKGGPHNVVFDEDAIPSGVVAEKISMDGQLGEEGETYSMSFDVAGNYAYYCEPHRGAGMNGNLVVG
mmetsp:Transcript_17397/g.31721  ORF Transcript_17397/g.31721 Transcript_17397/m.31721 type:complete len:227 (+) Transcript_17397:50-730(+)